MNVNTLTPTPPDWIELRCAALIARIRRSRWAGNCFADAVDFVGQGYAMDVALVKSWGYWGE